MVENVTRELAEVAWAYFQSIEKDGGLAAVLQSGSLASDIADVAAARAVNIARRKDALTGVSEFPNVSEARAKVDTPDIVAIDKAADIRAEKASGEISTLPDHGKGDLTTALVKAVGDNASSATIGAALRGEPMAITPLPRHRLAEDFEALRDASDAFAESTGKRPQVFLANIGRVADFTARATFAKNVVEAGGFETIPGAGGTEISDILDVFSSSGASAAVICSTDELYEQFAADLAKALKEKGAFCVYLAGRAAENEQALRDAGVDDFIYMGCDVLAVLTEGQRNLGVAA